MAGNVEVLRGAYQAFGGGDMQAVRETRAADIEFVGPNSTRMPGAGIHRGEEEVGRLFSGMRERWEDLRLSPDEFVEQGETVVVLGHLEGRAKATGRDLRVPFVHIWRMRGGRHMAARRSRTRRSSPTPWAGRQTQPRLVSRPRALRRGCDRVTRATRPVRL